MAFSLLGFVPSIIKAFTDSPVGQAKVPGFAQNVGQLVTSKTNALSTILVGYAITLLSGEPDIADRIIGNVILLYAAYGTFSRDTKFKKTP